MKRDAILVYSAQKEETDRLRSQTTGLIGAMDCFSEGIMLVNTDSENWSILFVNDAWSLRALNCPIVLFICTRLKLSFLAFFHAH